MIVIAAVSFFASSAVAQCAPARSPQALLDCAMANDPAVREAEARTRQSEAGVSSTRQRPNPDLETKGTWGDGASQVEIDLVQTVETGGKRLARVARARAEEQESGAQLGAARSEAAVKAATALYRLRQAQDELALVEEGLHTFARIGAQLRSRPRLLPEQEVSRSIFELAEADYTLRQGSLQAERFGLIKSLEASTGMSLSTAALDLPALKQEWPAIPEASPFHGPETLQSQAALAAAGADAAAARGASWPDLKLGPSFQRQSSEGQSQRMLGLNVGLSLPLYHRNGAGRERARRGEEAAALSAATTQARLQAERAAEKAKYEAAVASLKVATGRKELRSQHERVEDFFQRGLISSSLVIEAHRQMLEFARSRNEQELTAIRALWRIRAIDGDVLGGSL